MSESILDRLSKPRPVVMRPLGKGERELLMAAWEQAERQIVLWKRQMVGEIDSERRSLERAISKYLVLIQRILWCFPEVRFASPGEKFRIGDGPERKQPSRFESKLPVCAVIEQIEQRFGGEWVKAVNERIAAESA